MPLNDKDSPFITYDHTRYGICYIKPEILCVYKKSYIPTKKEKIKLIWFHYSEKIHKIAQVIKVNLFKLIRDLICR